MSTNQRVFKSVFTLELLLILGILAEPSWADRYVDNSDGTITDAQTKLVWQKADDGVQRNWDDAYQYCENLQPEGWRMPRIDELRTIVDYNLYNPAINPAFDSQLDTYWSGSSSVMPPDFGWYIYFSKGLVGWFSKDNAYYVRCVRGGPYWVFDPSVYLRKLNDDTVKDVRTNLVWQQSDDGIQRTWNEAQAYCDSLSLSGYPSGWRLPKIEELQTIIDYKTYDPALSTEMFNGHSGGYWSDTAFNYREGNNWAAHFDYGGAWWNLNTTLFYSRCVHDIAPVAKFVAPVHSNISYGSCPYGGTRYSMVWTGMYGGSDKQRCEGSGGHPGVDITKDRVSSENNKVYSIGKGLVVKKNNVIADGYGWGKYVVIKHDNVSYPGCANCPKSVYSIYAHLQTIDSLCPQENQSIGPDKLIGIMGNTGIKGGVHLHFQIQNLWNGKPFWPKYTDATGKSKNYPMDNNCGPNENEWCDLYLTDSQRQESAIKVRNNTINPVWLIANGIYR